MRPIIISYDSAVSFPPRFDQPCENLPDHSTDAREMYQQLTARIYSSICTIDKKMSCPLDRIGVRARLELLEMLNRPVLVRIAPKLARNLSYRIEGWLRAEFEK